MATIKITEYTKCGKKVVVAKSSTKNGIASAGDGNSIVQITQTTTSFTGIIPKFIKRLLRKNNV